MLPPRAFFENKTHAQLSPNALNMGLLTEGRPLTADELKKRLAYIREHGIIQFLNTWRNLKGIQNDELRFGRCFVVVVIVVN